MTQAQSAPTARRPRLLREITLLVVVALVVAVVVRAFVAQAFFIPSDSMEATLQTGDRIVASKVGLWFSDVQRGDVVVFQDPGGWLEPAAAGGSAGWLRQGLELVGLVPSSSQGDLVKRVIGVGGDRVRCCDADGQLTVNGAPLEEPYLYPGDRAASCPERACRFDVVVPQGSLWMMGDHRSVSLDSRLQPGDGGFVPADAVVGRAVVVFWPLSRFSVIERPATFDDVPAPAG